MITNPENVFEEVQNDIAAALQAVAPFDALQLPDGSAFQVLTEDEGDPEMLFTEFIAKCGLCVIVQSPTGKLISPEEQPYPQFNPLVIPISVSEAIIFNRSDQGTKVRLMVAVHKVLQTLHGFSVPTLKEKIFATRMMKDRDTQPGTDALVASRIITFEATYVRLDLTKA